MNSNIEYERNDLWRWLLGGVLVLALIVSSIWMVMDRDKAPKPQEKSTISTSTPKPTAKPTAKPTTKPTSTPEPTIEPIKDIDPVNNKVTVSFSAPLLGHVTKEYAMDHLIYSITMDYWHTHSGVDIEGVLGTAVKASADGVVAKAEKDPNLGYVIVLDHGNGWQSTYANLASVENVYVGQLVVSGEVIGTIGESSPIEFAEAAHLHFELSRDGKSVDPTQYLAGLNK